MATSRCPLCGHEGEDFVRRAADGRLACPRCGEVAGEAGAKPIDVEGRTLAAGTALAAVGGVSLLSAAGWLALVLLANVPPPPGPLPGQRPEAARAARIGHYLGQYLPGAAGLVAGVVELAGGIQLARRRAWPLAASGAVVAMVPCSCGFVVGLPAGIWALAVLLHPAVRAAFRSTRARPGDGS